MPLKQISSLSNIGDLESKYNEFLLKKKGEDNKVGELIKWWTIDPLTCLVNDFGHLTTPELNHQKYSYANPISFGQKWSYIYCANYSAG